MNKSLLTFSAVAAGALAIGVINGAPAVNAQTRCDRLTGAERSRCMMNQRRSGSPPQVPAPRETAPPVATRPAMPQAISPGSAAAPGQTVSGNRVTISWSAVSGASEYDFGIRDTTTNQLVVDTRTSQTSFSAPIVRGRTYRWNVRACNAAGCSSFTAPLHFQSEGAPSVGAITLPVRFPLFNQHDANASFYQSAAWANTIDTVDTRNMRKDLACLAVVYAKIEHARGNTRYRVGDATWTDRAGAIRINGVSGDIDRLDAEAIFAQFRQGNPVILWGPYKGYGHFVLAVGTDATGQIIVHDPSGGVRATVNPRTWRVTGSQALTEVSRYRTVRF